MLGMAFNALTRLHSRPAQLRRPGSPDLYSACRITPSNYFSNKKGPEFTEIPGREYIIPTTTLSGQFAQEISFTPAPASGTYRLSFNSHETTDLAWDASAADVQTALRLLAGMSTVVVSNITGGFLVVFAGTSAEPVLILPTSHGTLEDIAMAPVTITVTKTLSPWAAPFPKRGDRVIDDIYGSLTITYVDEIPDLGGAIMGFRCKCE